MHTAPANPLTCGCPDCARTSRPGRREILGLGGAGLVWASGLVPARAFAQTTDTPDAALQRMMAGNKRYVAGDMTALKDNLALQRSRTVEKQEPFAAVLSCADSRVPVELVFDQTIGRLFVVRVAGNIATPEVIASLEYGAAELGTPVIMVLAHQGCGAVKAAVAGEAVPGQISTLFASLRPAVEQGNHDYEATAKLNAKIQADVVAKASPVLADLSSKGKLKIVAGYYALQSGAVTLL